MKIAQYTITLPVSFFLDEENADKVEAFELASELEESAFEEAEHQINDELGIEVKAIKARFLEFDSTNIHTAFAYWLVTVTGVTQPEVNKLDGGLS